MESDNSLQGKEWQERRQDHSRRHRSIDWLQYLFFKNTDGLRELIEINSNVKADVRRS